MMSEPDWVLEYKVTEAFRIPDVSPKSLHSLVQTFKTRGSSNFEKYYLHNSVSAGGEQCDEECKTAQICGITEVDFDEYDVCVSPSTSLSPLKAATVSDYVAFLVFWSLSIGISQNWC